MTINIDQLRVVTDILSFGLAKGAETVSGVPFEIAQTLDEAKEQMFNLPAAISDLNAAYQKFETVGTAIRTMITLAEKSVSLDETEASNVLRASLEEKFINCAKIIAADAGRLYYQGPGLSITTKGDAMSALHIIKYMEPVIANMEQDLITQKELINEVISETVSFLGIVAHCYPEADGVEELDNIIKQANNCIGAAPMGALH